MVNRLVFSWGARARDGWALARATVAREATSLAFVGGILLLLMLLRQAVQFAVSAGVPDFPVAYAVANFWADLWCHGLSVLAMYAVIQPVRRRLRSEGFHRVAWLSGAVVVGAAVATGIRLLEMTRLTDGADAWEMDLTSMAAWFVRFGLPAAFVVTVAEFNRREILSLEAMRRAEADRAALEQETMLARLKTLEAQIEPHFLFNTLANVRRLYETDAAAGETMLQRLMRYLVVALPSMRDELPTLGREAQLIEAYLDLQQVRMGRRLRYSVDIAPALHAIGVPSMMLLTLVENAIKHGLAPLREGGRVDVAATIDGEALQLAVTDTGRGFGGDSSGMGTGLANIRARLAAMFGDAAALTLMPGPERGLLATIRLPMRPVA